MARGLGQAAAVIAIGAVLVWILRPAALSATWVALAAVASAVVGGTLAIQPWVPRLETQWPMLLLGCQGVMFAIVAAVGLVLYSSTRPDPLVFGVVVVSGFLAALFGMVSVYARTAAAHRAIAADRAAE